MFLIWVLAGFTTLSFYLTPLFLYLFTLKSLPLCVGQYIGAKSRDLRLTLFPQLRNLLEHSIVPASSKPVIGVSAVKLHPFGTSLLGKSSHLLSAKDSHPQIIEPFVGQLVYFSEHECGILYSMLNFQQYLHGKEGVSKYFCCQYVLSPSYFSRKLRQ